MTEMTDTARHILHVVCIREGLPITGWEHYFTSIGDDGISTFSYDRAEKDTFGGLVVRVTPEGYEVDEDNSWLDLLRA